MASRATRSATRQNSNEPQVPTPSAGTRRTPRTPAGRKQKGGERELPALTPNISQAYGGAGRATLAESLRRQQTSSDFAQQLEDARAEVEEPDERPRPRRPSRNSTPSQSRASSVAASEQAQTPRAGRSKKNTPRNSILQPVREEREKSATSSVQSDEESEQSEEDHQKLPNARRPEEDDEATTLLENNRSYAQADRIAQNIRLERSSRPDEPAQVSPWERLKVMFRNTYDSAKQNRPSGRSVLIITSVLIALGGMLTALYSHPNPDEIFTDVHPVDALRHYGYAIWDSMPSTSSISFSRPASFGEYPHDLAKEMSRISNELKRITEASTIRDSTIEELNRMLPDNIVGKANKDGTYEIPDQFWRALKEKIDLSFGSRDSAPSWEAFIRRNKAEMQSMLSSEVDYALQSARSAKTIISQEELTQLLRENFASLSSEIARVNDSFERRYNNILASSADTAISTTKKTLSEQLKHIPKFQLDTLAIANLLRNSDLALKNVNFFSSGMGAIVDPFLTSSTLSSRTPSRMSWFFMTRPSAKPPISALESWEEPGDCWCAASPDRNDMAAQQNEQDARKVQPKAQLAVVLPDPVYPEKVTVEHIAKGATLNIGAAPRAMELWISVPDEERRELVGRTAESYLHASSPRSASSHGYSTNDSDDDDDDDSATMKKKRSRRRKPSRKFDRALDQTYVKVAQWEYDVEAPNHVQTFAVDVPLEELGVAVDRVVVRATSNWGGDHTCLYRVRMHGAAQKKKKGQGS